MRFLRRIKKLILTKKTEIKKQEKKQSSELDVGLDNEDIVIFSKKVDDIKNDKKDEKHIDLYVDGIVSLKVFVKKGEYIRNHSFQAKISIPESQKNNKKVIEEALNMELSSSGTISDHGYGHQIGTYNKYEFITSNDFLQTEVFKDIVKIPMMNATFPKLDISGLADYKFEANMCVYGALEMRYGWKKEQLFNIFSNFHRDNKLDPQQKKELKMADGITSEMLLYLSRQKDFSLYGLDWNMNLFIKNISINQNYKPFVYILNNDHCYLMNDDKEIMKLIRKNSERKNNNVSSLYKSFENKNTFDLFPTIEDIEIDDLKNHKDHNIIYSRDDLYEIVAGIFKIHNHQITSKNMKLSGHKIVYVYINIFNLHLYADINYDEEEKISWKDIKELCKKVNIPFKNQRYFKYYD